MLYPLHTRIGLGSAVRPFGKELPLRFDFAFGFEYEDALDGTGALGGESLRLTTKAGIYAIPFISLLDQRLEFSFATQYWKATSNSGMFDDQNSEYGNLSASINYFFDDNKRIAMGASYVNGDDPSSGLLDQSYFEVGVHVRTGD